jgi:cytoskeletal protein CcmA (bactofilin family)
MKKLLLFLFIVFFSLSAFVSPVLAQEHKERVILTSDQVVNKDYFAAGDTVTVLGTVNGDAYVAGGEVTFDGTINGDIIATGGNIIIRGTAQNVRVAGGNIIIQGVIEKNLTVAGGNVTLDDDATLKGSLVAGSGSITVASPVGKDAWIGGGSVIINNVINGDLHAGVGKLTLQEGARINGNLAYASDEKADIFPGATVSGQTTHSLPEKKTQDTKEEAFLGLSAAALFFKLMNMVSMLIVGLLLISLAPAFVKRVGVGITKHPWQSLGIGLAVFFATPVIFVLLLLPVVTIPLALIVLAVFCIVLYVAKLFFIYLLGEKIIATFNKTLPAAVVFIIGLLLFEIVVLIPIAGWIFDMAAVLLGLGSLMIEKKHVYTLLRKQKTV